MNSPDTEYEHTLASPSERNHNIEQQIAQQLVLLKEQVQNVNGKLQVNLKILGDKQFENKQLKDLLTKLEANMQHMGITQSTDTTLTSETVCASCKTCSIF